MSEGLVCIAVPLETTCRLVDAMVGLMLGRSGEALALSLHFSFSGLFRGR